MTNFRNFSGEMYPKKIYSLAFLLVCSLVGIIACQPTPSCVIPVDTRASSLTVRFAEGTKCDREPYPLQSINVYKGAPSEYSEYLWAISIRYPGRKIRELKYGVLPEGFSVWTEAKPLVPGETIYIESQTTVTRGLAKVVIQN